MAIKTINDLNSAPIPLLGTDKILVSRDGLNVNKIDISNLPLPLTTSQTEATALVGANSTNMIMPDGTTVVNMPRVTWLELPPPSTAGGTVWFVTDVGVVGSMWVSDGVQWRPQSDVVLFEQVDPTSITDISAVRQTINSFTLPTGIMGIRNVLDIDYVFSYPNSATTKTMYVSMSDGVTSYDCIGRSRTTTAYETGLARIINRNSASFQLHPFKNATYPVAASSTATTSTVDTSGQITISYDGTFGTAGTGSNSITLTYTCIKIRA